MPNVETSAASFLRSAAKIEVCHSDVCVLIVDDEPKNLLALEVSFKNSGYKVIAASSGTQAIAEALVNDFAVILLDVQMPELDGFETARKIHELERSKRTPIIFLTAFHNNEHFASIGYATGAVDYLYKPLNVEILKAKVAVFVDLHRKNRELQRREEWIAKREIEEKENQIAELRKSTHRKYQDLVEGIRNGIVWLADGGKFRISFVSPHAEELLGYPIETWYSDHQFLLNKIFEEDREKVVSAIEAVRKEEGSFDLEHRISCADGNSRWFATNIRSRRAAHGLEISGLSFDITRLKLTENSLRDMINIRDEFLSIASHELKTPLTPLQLQMEGFRRLSMQGRLSSVPNEKIERMLNISISQVETLTKLIDRLLDVSRIKAGKFVLSRERVDFVSIIKKVVETFWIGLGTTGAETKLDLPENLVGYWDPFRLEQVIVNLLSNAQKYGNGKPIEISLVGDKRHATLKIKDHGIGIDKSNLERIFQRFERAVSAENFSGLGLGLYISKQIIELHSGQIWLDSELGKGSTFTVNLPLEI